MSRSLTLLRFSLGQLLAGRRLLIVALLVALPLVLPAVFAAGADVDPASFTLDLFRQLVLPVLLPVVALTFSTSSLGSELRDGTITNLLLKPIPRLFEGKNAGDQLRVWVLGCATGEEAYSIAMLLCEQ